MIYGEKFLNITESSLNVSNIDIDNFISLLEKVDNKSYDVENIDEASYVSTDFRLLDKAIDALIDGVITVFKRLLNIVIHFIDLAKLKLVQLYDKVLTAIDTKINGQLISDKQVQEIEKYLITDQDATSESNSTNESSLLEATNGSKKISLFTIDYKKDFLRYIPDNDTEIKEFIDFIQVYIKDFVKYLNCNPNDDFEYRDKLTEYKKEYEGDEKKGIVGIKSKIEEKARLMVDNLAKMEKDLKEFKDKKHNGSNSDYTTPNGLISCKVIDPSNDSELKNMRDIIRENSKSTAAEMKYAVDIKKSTMKNRTTIDNIYRRYKSKKSNAKYSLSNYGSCIKDCLSMLTSIYSKQLKCVNREMQIMMYVTKHDMSIAIRYIKKWNGEASSNNTQQ